MGEVGALGAAFDAEFGKALSTLPSLSEGERDHETRLNHYRQAQRVQEMVAYFGSRLPPYASVQRILSFADKLVRDRGEHELARDACFAFVRALRLHEQEAQRMDQQARLSYHAQACMGIETCEAAVTLAADRHIKHPRTLQSIVGCLQRLQEVILMVLPSESLYWLALNGTIHMFGLAQRLLTAGFIQQVLPHLVFCVKVMHAHIIYSTVTYLPWRTQLYVSLCAAYFDIGAFDLARMVIQEGLDNIDALIKLQKLDPVPATPAVQAAYRTARASFSALQLKLAVLSAPPADDAAAAAGAKGAAAAKGGKNAAPPPPDALPASLEPFKPLLQEVSLTPLFRLTALMESVQVTGRRVVRHEAITGLPRDVFEVVSKETQPKLQALKAALLKQAEQRQRKPQAEEAEEEQQAQEPTGESRGTPRGQGSVEAIRGDRGVSQEVWVEKDQRSGWKEARRLLDCLTSMHARTQSPSPRRTSPPRPPSCRCISTRCCSAPPTTSSSTRSSPRRSRLPSSAWRPAAPRSALRTLLRRTPRCKRSPRRSPCSSR
jgi:hypothetical protein